MSLVAGVLAIQASIFGYPAVAIQLILTAAILDGLDGTLARRFGSHSEMGAHLDALADLVAFGVAPAVALTLAHQSQTSPWVAPAAVVFCVAGAHRLARHNVEGRGDSYSGLPITAAGAFMAALNAPFLGLDSLQMTLIALALALLMVSRIPYHAGQGERQRLALLAAPALALIWADWLLAVGAFLLFYAAYTLSGILPNLRDRSRTGVTALRARSGGR